MATFSETHIIHWWQKYKDISSDPLTYINISTSLHATTLLFLYLLNTYSFHEQIFLGKFFIEVFKSSGICGGQSAKLKGIFFPSRMAMAILETRTLFIRKISALFLSA